MTKRRPAPPHYPVTLSPEEGRFRADIIIAVINRMISGEFEPVWTEEEQREQELLDQTRKPEDTPERTAPPPSSL